MPQLPLTRPKLAKKSSRYRELFENAPVAYLTLNRRGLIVLANLAATRLLGTAREALLKQPLASFLGQPSAADSYPRSGKYRIVREDGQILWLHLTATSVHSKKGKPEFRVTLSDITDQESVLRNSEETDGIGTYIGSLGMFTDIGRRREAELLLAWEKRALEQIVSSAPLLRQLEDLTLGLESHWPGALCSILLLDEDGVHLRHGAAPSLPEAYNRGVDGVAIGPTQGSCGTAVFTGRQVIVADVSTDPLWAEFREMALEHGLRACWSTPIQSLEGTILGTFAIYYAEPRVPSSRELEVIDRAVHIAYLAIERKRAEATLREANEKLRLSNESLERRVLDRTSQLRDLTIQLNQVEECERLRVADALHEGLLQLLAAVAIHLDGVKKHLKAGTPSGCLGIVKDTLMEAIAVGRDLTHDLYPQALHSLDFGYALNWLARRHSEKNQLQVQVDVAPKFDVPQRELRIMLFRGANELLINVHKHAQVAQAHVTLSSQPDGSLRLTVSDSGAGFNPATEGSGRGFGLFSLRERVGGLGGYLQVESTPGGGSRVSITVPTVPGGR